MRILLAPSSSVTLACFLHSLHPFLHLEKGGGGWQQHLSQKAAAQLKDRIDETHFQ